MITLFFTTRFLPSAFGLGILSIALAAPAATLAPFNTEPATNGPMPAAEVVAQTKLPPGFRLSVFAAEPEVHHSLKRSPFVCIRKEVLAWRCGRPCFNVSL
jgi:hypothetical protein